MDALLTAIIGVTQLVLGGMGVYVSLRPPKPQHHWYWISAFMGVGLIGIVLTGWGAQRASNAQEKAAGKITEAIAAATNANTAATKANEAATASQKEIGEAREEEKEAQRQLANLINKKSIETQSSIEKIPLHPLDRRVPSESFPQLTKFLSQQPGRIRVLAVANDSEAFRLAQELTDLFKASRWEVEEEKPRIFFDEEEKLTGILITSRGDPVLTGQKRPINDWGTPVGHLESLMSMLRLSVAFQRSRDADEGLIGLFVFPRVGRN